MNAAIKHKHGMVLGKFHPFHKGHIYLIEQARLQCEKLTVFCCSIKSEYIHGHYRRYWIKSIFPDVDVIYIDEEFPQKPEDSDNFWNIWVNAVKSRSSNIDCLFTSEDYGWEFSKRLGIQHIIVDLDRKTVPISGTMVRENPYKNWNYIPSIVRPYFMKKVVLVGPESTGKTYTSEFLANHFNTLWVPEYGREYLNNKKSNIEYKDISHIAAGQMDNEQLISIRAAERSNLIICDTDLIVTQIWSEIYFGTCPEWIIRENMSQRYDLYLLFKPDIKWVDDGTREFPNMREFHFNRIKKELDERHLPYKIIYGDYENRLKMSISFVEELMLNNTSIA